MSGGGSMAVARIQGAIAAVFFEPGGWAPLAPGR
jgi:hypothetical protein